MKSAVKYLWFETRKPREFIHLVVVAGIALHIVYQRRFPVLAHPARDPFALGDMQTVYARRISAHQRAQDKVSALLVQQRDGPNLYAQRRVR